MSLPRRSFLIAAAAAAGASYFDLARAFAGAWRKRDASPFPVGLQSYTLRNFPVERALAIIRDDLALRFVELYPDHFPVTAETQPVQAMRALLRQNDLELNAHGVHGFGADHEANRKIFAFAKAAGIRNLSADPKPEAFASLEKLVVEFGVRIAIHNHGPGSRYDKIASVVTAIKDSHPSIGACIDTGHYIRSAEDPVKAVHELKNRVFGVHLKDFADQKAETKDVVLGKGHLDVPGVLKALREERFPADGALSIEFEGSPENPVPDVKQCVGVVMESLRKLAPP